MSQNSAAYLAKADYAVKTLLKAPAISVLKSMKLADFSKSVIADKNVRQVIRRHLPGGTKKGLTATCDPPLDIVCDNQTISKMSPLTVDVSSPVQSPQRPPKQPPKRKQQRMTASAAQLKRVKDL